MESFKVNEAIKVIAVELYNQGKPINKISSEYDIALSTLYKWIKEHDKSKSASIIPEEKSKYYNLLLENISLKKELMILKSVFLDKRDVTLPKTKNNGNK